MVYKDFFISQYGSVKDAFKKLDTVKDKMLLVVDENESLLGTISEEDIRHYILQGKSLDKDIMSMFNKDPVCIRRKDFSLRKAKELLAEEKTLLLPIIDEMRKVLDCMTRKDMLSKDKSEGRPVSGINVPVVIMSGGKSTRLEPFSKIFPKPLIPVGDKPMIEIIIDEFRKQGIKEYYLTLNYKGEMIESYFNHVEKDYTVKYIWEKDFFGTAGSLKLLGDTIGSPFIVSNCDIIVRADFKDVLNFHNEQGAFLTVLSSIQHYKIPYGVISFREGGEVINIHEKPEYTLTINAGCYMLNKECLEFIPENTHFDMTDLIKSLIKHKRKVITYPVNENDYIDIGQWEEYRRSKEKLKMLL